MGWGRSEKTEWNFILSRFYTGVAKGTDSGTRPPRFESQQAAAAAKSLQSCPNLWDTTDSSPPGSAVPGILQARTLEWVAISFPNAWKWKVKVKSLSHVPLFETPWTTAYQAPPSMGFSRQEYWSGLPLPFLTKLMSFCLVKKIMTFWFYLFDLVWIEC